MVKTRPCKGVFGEWGSLVGEWSWGSKIGVVGAVVAHAAIGGFVRICRQLLVLNNLKPTNGREIWNTGYFLFKEEFHRGHYPNNLFIG
jgi:hypothetical protein